MGILKRLMDSEDLQNTRTRNVSGILALYVFVVGVAMSLFHLYTAYFGLLRPLWQNVMHVVFVLAIGFIVYPASKKKEKGVWFVLDIVLTVIAVAAPLHLIVNYDQIVMRPGLPEPIDVFFAIITVLIVLELGRRTSGPVLPLLTIGFILYALLGPYIPGYFRHSGVQYDYLAYYLFSTTEGIWGTPVGVSAKYIYLFMIFGALVVASGCGKLIMDCASAIAGKARGGPAKMAVLSSAVFGSISGSAVANVVSTGTFTIPMMKKLGYQPHYAAAIEAVASTGGIIMPPIMGAAAFIMAEMMGVSYFAVVKAAWLPAVLYYLAVLSMVHLRAAKEGITGLDDDQIPRLMTVLKDRGYLLFPLFLLVYLMVVAQKSPMMCAFWAVLSVIACAALKKETRMDAMQILRSFESAARTAITLIPAICMAGIIMGVILMTGLALRVSGVIVSVAGDSQIILLLMTMVAALVLGMGVTAAVAYIIPAILVAPILVKWGVPVMAANMFVFYFAVISYITPPVAIASYAAAGVANADMWKTGIRAFLLGITGFIVPFMIIYNPALIMEGTVPVIIRAMITASIGVIALAVGIEGWALTKAGWVERLLCIGAALSLIEGGLITDIAGFVMLAIVLALQTYKKGKTVSLPGGTSS